MIGILTDVTKCVGCNKCVDACVEENGLGPHVPTRRANPDGLGSQRFTSIVRAPQGGRYVRKQCRHCLEPACVSACIVGALTRNQDGAVVYDAKKCMGCRYCMMACPFAIPRYSWENVVPYIRKCKFCYDNRIAQGKQPACTEACPEKATIFGDRDDLLREAHARINGNPGKYINKVYGETEIGGTAVLYISDVPLEFLGWSKEMSPTPLPSLTRGVLKEVPLEFIGMGVVMSSIYWITGRRRQVAIAEAQADINAAKAADKEKHDDQA
ncbi:MAG TPA: 4Fe-4S dicluster domain-containing protein [bacterium]|nr:4Fe-4S dicluster domain-containing protein [bacterium]